MLTFEQKLNLIKIAFNSFNERPGDSTEDEEICEHGRIKEECEICNDVY